MNTSFLTTTRSWLLTLAMALLLALATLYTPIVLEELTGSTFTSHAYACKHTGGTCG